MAVRIRHRIQLRERAQELLDAIWRQPSIVHLIHYSCESFYDRTDGSSPRITSIAVRNLGTGQTVSFSIHLLAEREKLPLAAIPERYNELERAMLEEFYDFVQRHLAFRWLHWNMRDVNYGFAAIEHRYQVLGGNPITIPDANRTDLAWILIDLYGPAYAAHPRLENLLALNAISRQHFLTGAEEATAFEHQAYVKCISPRFGRWICLRIWRRELGMGRSRRTRHVLTSMERPSVVG